MLTLFDASSLVCKMTQAHLNDRYCIIFTKDYLSFSSCGHKDVFMAGLYSPLFFVSGNWQITTHRNSITLAYQREIWGG